MPPPVLCWSDISQVLTSTVDELAGPLSEKRRGAPLSSGDKLKLSSLDKQVADAWERVRCAQGFPAEHACLTAWRLERRRRKDFLKKARSRHLVEMTSLLRQSLDDHDWGRFYKHLRHIGVATSGLDFSGSAPFSLAQLRAHNLDVSSRAKAVDLADIDKAVKQRPVDHTLGDLPTRFEFSNAIASIRESAPGKDGVSAYMIRFGGDLSHDQLYKIMCQMWTTPATQWESILRTGLGVPLHKSGDRNNLDNYRTVVLLPLVSRLLG